jgi:polar amino acid transport system substrate-binding protein
MAIAATHLGDAGRWPSVIYANPDLPGDAAQPLEVGRELKLPCPDTVAGTSNDTPLRQAGAEMVLITGSDYAPFTHRDWPGQGMVTELVNAALENSPDPVPYTIVWDDVWAGHLDRLSAKDFDMGFPWFRPECETLGDTDPRCAAFHFSDPLVDLVILLFVRADAEFPFETDADLEGRRLCRPEGYFTHDLDRPDRQWLSREAITLRQPPTPDDCFALLMAGEVDAVALNEFLGVSKLFELGLTDQVVPLPRPLSVEGLHVIISKTHWRGTTHLYRFNAGLAKLRQSDRYNAIVSRHLTLFWEQIKG